MSLRTKAIIVSGLTMLLLLFVQYLTSKEILLDGFVTLEERLVKENVARTAHALMLELDEVDIIAQDYAARYDSRKFFNTSNPEDSGLQLGNAIFSKRNISFIAYADATGKIVFAKAFDLPKNKEIEVPSSILEFIRQNPSLTNYTGPAHGIKGAIWLPEGPTLLASRPVLPSDGPGQNRGVLIIGRELDTASLARVQRITQLPVSFSPISQATGDSYLPPGGTVKTLDEQLTAGSDTIQGIDGKPSVLFTITMPRTIYHQGQKILLYLAISLLFTSIIFTCLLLVFLEKGILTRLAIARQVMKEIRLKGNLNARMPVDHHDELSSLANHFNEMLVTLRNTQEQSLAREEELRQVQAQLEHQVEKNTTELNEANQALQFLSCHDPLTGLYNRTSFEDTIRNLSTTVGIVICDIDGLKFVNDTLGHDVGNKILIAAAAAISQGVAAFKKENCQVFRICGDEFAVIARKVSSTDLVTIAQDIAVQVTAFNKSSPAVPLSLSTGFAITSSNSSIKEVLSEAENNMFREKLHHNQSIRCAMVKALIKALEARDKVTGNHAYRMQKLTDTLARALTLPEHLINDLKLLGRFHDLGKVGIPDRILNKPEKLTPEEYLEMQRHPVIGKSIAENVPELIPIADWIWKHHERWDGKGYPLGLQGKDIPLACQIISIVDAFDAMTSDRPYRKALPTAEAIVELKKNAGTQFDPHLVERFIKIIDE